MEIYLCHMVIFRVMEKLGVTHLFASDVLSYVVTALGTIVGSIVFAIAVKKGLKIAETILKRISARDKKKQ